MYVSRDYLAQEIFIYSYNVPKDEKVLVFIEVIFMIRR
jgi:hypothetical protein